MESCAYRRLCRRLAPHVVASRCAEPDRHRNHRPNSCTAMPAGASAKNGFVSRDRLKGERETKATAPSAPRRRAKRTRVVDAGAPRARAPWTKRHSLGGSFRFTLVSPRGAWWHSVRCPKVSAEERRYECTRLEHARAITSAQRAHVSHP